MASPTSASWFSSYFSRFSPVPAFPEYTGPYKVGSIDVEIPVTQLKSQSPAPEAAKDIHTVLFRVFYPAVPESREDHIHWLPEPQRYHVSAFSKFLGLNSGVSELLSFLPRHLFYTTIPAHGNAELEQSSLPDARWPLMMFSHGLGGSRNSYSYVAGSLASHGMIVVCPEHRDGSAIATFVRLPTEGKTQKASVTARKAVAYKTVSHQVSPEVYEARETQLRVRTWEIGLIHQALLDIDAGDMGWDEECSSASLAPFADRMRMHQPGSIVFGGHSFGAATTVQLLKSTYYADHPTIQSMENPIFRPEQDSPLRRQVTAATPTMLLDMWCLPLVAPNSAPLFDLPLPVYDNVANAPGGEGLLSVESEAFFKWKEHLNTKARVLSPDPTAKIVTDKLFEKPDGSRHSRANFFYVLESAHLNQSDFGILFPWVSKKFFGAGAPERALRLNLRAQLQFLRANNVPISQTALLDLADGPTEYVESLTTYENGGIADDQAIFGKDDGHPVEYWRWINIVGMGEVEDTIVVKTQLEKLEENEKKMQGELEPAKQSPPPFKRTISAINAIGRRSAIRRKSAVGPVMA